MQCTEFPPEWFNWEEYVYLTDPGKAGIGTTTSLTLIKLKKNGWVYFADNRIPSGKWMATMDGWLYIQFSGHARAPRKRHLLKFDEDAKVYVLLEKDEPDLENKHFWDANTKWHKNKRPVRLTLHDEERQGKNATTDRRDGQGADMVETAGAGGAEELRNTIC